MFESLGVLNIGVFVVGTVLVILSPGSNSLFVLATAIKKGIRAGYAAAAGVFIGDSFLMLLASLGVDSLFRVYPLAFSAIQYAGAGYLAYLGIMSIRQAFRPAMAEGAPSLMQRDNFFTRSLALSLSNPKAILFFVSFFVQFVEPSKGHPGFAFFILACIVQVVSVTYLSIVIFLGAKVAALLKDNIVLRRLAPVVVGLVFLGFSARLALRAL